MIPSKRYHINIYVNDSHLIWEAYSRISTAPVIIPPSDPKEQYELIVKYLDKSFADSLSSEELAHESIHAIQVRDDILNPNKIKEEIDLEGVDWDNFEADRERKRAYFSRPPEIMAFAYDVAAQTNKWQTTVKEYQDIGGEVLQVFERYIKEYQRAKTLRR